jgi:hypothetical protein
LPERRRSFVAVVQAAKDHFPSGRLVDRSDENVHSLVDQAARAVHDHHRAVFKVRNTLIDFLAFAENEDPHAFTRKNGRTEGVGEQIDVENVDALDRSDLIEIEIVGDDFGLEAERQFDELAIDITSLAGNVLDDAYFVGWQLLNALQDF